MLKSPPAWNTLSNWCWSGFIKLAFLKCRLLGLAL